MHNELDLNLEAVRKLRGCLRGIERHLVGVFKDQMNCCGMPLAQCHVLLEFEKNRVMNITELSGRLKLDPSTLSRTVEVMVKADLLNRAEDPSNRRRKILHLTDRGLEAQRRINEGCDRFYAELLARLPVEQHALLLESVEFLAGLLSGKDFSVCQSGIGINKEV